jgi:hypothetical protein
VRWPTLWLARIHAVTAVGVMLGLLMIPIGFLLPVSYLTLDWVNSATFAAVIGTLLITIYWSYLQLRSQALVPFFGRRWVCPVYAYSIVVLNLGPFLLVNIYYRRITHTWARASPYWYDYLLNPVFLAAIVAAELLVILTVARSVTGRILLLAASGILVSSFILMIVASAFPRSNLDNFVIVGVIVTGYLLAGLISIRLQSLHVQRVLASAAVFHLLTPLLPFLIILVLPELSVFMGITRNTKLLEILLWTILGYGVISYPLERRLARLRATPA